jgi:Right handed beta helix region
MTRKACILASILIGMALRAIPAAATTVTVNCNDKMTISKAISVLNPLESNTIRVIGACNEFVAFSEFTQLSFVGVKTASGPATITSANGTAFWIVGSNVQLSNLIIQSSVICRDFSVCNFSGNTVENASGLGVWLDNASGTFNGDLITKNVNSGLTLSASRARLSSLTVTGTSAGPNGPGNGIDVDGESTITADQLTVNGNQGAGISLVGNSQLVNQFWVGPLMVSSNANGGIWVTQNSSTDLSGATVVDNTGAAGVVITGNSEAAFWGGGTFTGNSSGDVYCGPLNGVAASPQSATIGVTNCPNTYQ